MAEPLLRRCRLVVVTFPAPSVGARKNYLKVSSTPELIRLARDIIALFIEGAADIVRNTLYQEGSEVPESFQVKNVQNIRIHPREERILMKLQVRNGWVIPLKDSFIKGIKIAKPGVLDAPRLYIKSNSSIYELSDKQIQSYIDGVRIVVCSEEEIALEDLLEESFRAFSIKLGQGERNRNRACGRLVLYASGVRDGHISLPFLDKSYKEWR